MPTANETSALLNEIQTGIKSFAIDPVSAIKSLDVSTIVIAGLSLVFFVFLFDLALYLLAVYKGEADEFTPYSRSIAVMAADAWSNRRENDVGYYYDPYVRSR